MKAVNILPGKGKVELAVSNVAIPEPKYGEVLIRMSYAPIHPKDLGSFKSLAAKSQPSGIGLEGSGTVVKSGGGWYGWFLQGKRVACCSNPGSPSGTWAEYMCTKAINCLPLKNTTSSEEGALLMVNPLTVMMFIDSIRSGGHSAAVQTASLSAVGKMMTRECLRAEIPLINIVRKPEQVQQVIDNGGIYALNSEDPDFITQLNELCLKLNVSVAFDCVGGEMTGNLLRSLRGPGVVYVYGFLANPYLQNIDGASFVFQNKRVQGGSIFPWFRSKSLYQMYNLQNEAQKLIKSTLKTTIARRYSLDQVEEAIRHYKANMSEGKVLIELSKL